MQPVSTCPYCEMGTSHCIKVTAACSWHLAQIAPALLSPDIQCCSVEQCASEHELVLLLPFIRGSDHQQLPSLQLLHKSSLRALPDLLVCNCGMAERSVHWQAWRPQSEAVCCVLSQQRNRNLSDFKP